MKKVSKERSKGDEVFFYSKRPCSSNARTALTTMFLARLADNQAGRHYGLFYTTTIRRWCESYGVEVLHGVFMDLGTDATLHFNVMGSTVVTIAFHHSFVVSIFLGSIFWLCKDPKSATREQSNSLTLKNNLQHQSNRWTDARLCFAYVWRRNMPGWQSEINPACCICRYCLAVN